MTAFNWWRSWHGAPMDDKWPVIAQKADVKTGLVAALAWALMDYASQQESRGSIEGFDTEAYSVYTGFPEDEIVKAIQAMSEIKRPVVVNNLLINWGKRQPKREDPTVNERSRRHRDMQHKATQSNTESEDETLHSLSLSLSLSEREDVLRDWLIEVTGLDQGGPASAKVVKELIEMNPILEDIQAGYDWFMSQPGKALKYWGQIVGPTRTAQSMRVGKSNGRKADPNPLGLEPAPEFN